MTYPFDIYLAQPYSDPAPNVRAIRFSCGARAASWLMDRGMAVYSPIVHSHPLVPYIKNNPTGWSYWERVDSRIIGACRAFLVLEINGWENSVGVAAETKIAERLGLPVGRMVPLVDPIENEPCGYVVTGLESMFKELM